MANNNEDMLKAMKQKIRPRKQPFEELFMTEEERQDEKLEKITNIPTEQLYDFKNHPFKIKDDEEMNNLVESIIENGILVPLIVRPRKEKDGGYEIVAGHRRRHASQIALAKNYLRFKEVPCIVKDLSDDEATILMVDSNIQREEILPSEKAFAYKMKLEALKHQGKRLQDTSRPMDEKLEIKYSEDNLTSAPVGQKLNEEQTSRQLLANESNESREQIRRYIRLTHLIPELLNLVDEKRVAFRPAVELSYLSTENQAILYDIYIYDEVTPSMSQAIKMKNLERENKLTEDVIQEIMEQEKGNTKEKNGIDYKLILKYFPKDYSKEDMFNKVIELLEDYNKKWKRDGVER